MARFEVIPIIDLTKDDDKPAPKSSPATPNAKSTNPTKDDKGLVPAKAQKRKSGSPGLDSPGQDDGNRCGFLP